MKNVQLIAKKVLDLLAEIEMYNFYKQKIRKEAKRLFNQYQKGKYDYFTYEKRLQKLLKGKTEEEVAAYYNSYILSLLKRIEAYNSQIFYEAYQDKRYKELELAGEASERGEMKAPVPAEMMEKLETIPAGKVPEEAAKVEAEKKLAVPEKEAKEMPEPAGEEPEVSLVELKPRIWERAAHFIKRLFIRREVEKKLEEVKGPEAAEAGAKGKKKAKPSRLKLKKKSPFEVMWKKPKPKPLPKPAPKPKEEKKKERGKVGLGTSFGWTWFKNLFSRGKVEFTKKKSEVPLSTLQIEQLRRKAQPEITAQIEKITATALTREAKRIRDIMEKRKALKIYHPSFFGSMANLTIRKASLFLLDNFPDFFKDLYHALRLANIKVLSNTYVNMMVFGVFIAFFIGSAFFGIFFSTTELPAMQVLFRTLMMGVLMGLISFAGFYAYPYSVMKQRRRSINTNLPFAINHMAAVSGSGVSPTKMFKLIAESKEYGEISIEIEKIVNYIEIFGYDVLTSIKAVAAQTPSYQFKDFFEGMISTTETGGDLSAFLSQKADEAMLNYKLERKKYTETISTYSDIYTGILIAAPLFFVAALSLVSLLGGQIGGVDVSVVIVLGTYVIIPVLNVAFITFLELTQPEI